MARCPYCRSAQLKKNRGGPPAKTCGRPDCIKAHRAALKRNERAAKSAVAITRPRGPQFSDRADTPFGCFESHVLAWMYVLDGSHNDDREYTKSGGYREWADDNLADITELPTEEFLELLVGFPSRIFDAPDNQNCC